MKRFMTVIDGVGHLCYKPIQDMLQLSC